MVKLRLIGILEIIGLLFLISFALMGTITLALMSQSNVIAWTEPNLIIRLIEFFGGFFGIIIATKIILNKIHIS